MSEGDGTADEPTPQKRLEDELMAVECIYPGQVEWRARNREFYFRSLDGRSSLLLRLPDDYLVDALPEVITANAGRIDVRDRVREVLRGWDPVIEALDALTQEFLQASEHVASAEAIEQSAWQSRDTPDVKLSSAKATIAIWLHHLLNTNKRKQVISPASNEVSGWSKPGYPGMLLFTGPAADVQAHVKELKGLRWQAFQVRLEVDEEWPLPHKGVVEAESVSALVAGLEPVHRDLFSSVMIRS